MSWFSNLLLLPNIFMASWTVSWVSRRRMVADNNNFVISLININSRTTRRVTQLLKCQPTGELTLLGFLIERRSKQRIELPASTNLHGLIWVRTCWLLIVSITTWRLFNCLMEWWFWALLIQFGSCNWCLPTNIHQPTHAIWVYSVT